MLTFNQEIFTLKYKLNSTNKNKHVRASVHTFLFCSFCTIRMLQEKVYLYLYYLVHETMSHGGVGIIATIQNAIFD